MKPKYYYLCSLLVVLLFTSSCEDKDIAPDSILTAEIDGVPFFTQSRQINVRVVMVGDDDEPLPQVFITAENADGHKLKLFFEQADEGMYAIQYGEAEASFKPYRKGEYEAERGRIIVTDYSRRRIAGNFYFEAENFVGREIQVIDGEFDIFLE